MHKKFGWKLSETNKWDWLSVGGSQQWDWKLWDCFWQSMWLLPSKCKYGNNKLKAYKVIINNCPIEIKDDIKNKGPLEIKQWTRLYLKNV